ncbi:MAG: DNA-binding protein [Zoogloeaceae bacterium]|jgi:gp16 family phage-associated protein|nr:DNA-binding protein [Zoogloeaceae bacterium]
MNGNHETVFTRLPYPQTPETAAAWFWANGVCVTRWARHFSFARQTVADLLRGQLKGNWGASHKAAIALGLKPDPGHPRIPDVEPGVVLNY